MKVTQFFMASGRGCGASAAARPSTACGPAARRLRAHHRDEQPRRGAAGGRGAHLPPEELPAADARDQRRLDDAHPDRHRAALRRVRRRRRARSTDRRRRSSVGARRGTAGGRGRRRRPATSSCRSTASRCQTPDDLGEVVRTPPSRATRVPVVVDPRRRAASRPPVDARLPTPIRTAPTFGKALRRGLRAARRSRRSTSRSLGAAVNSGHRHRSRRRGSRRRASSRCSTRSTSSATSPAPTTTSTPGRPRSSASPGQRRRRRSRTVIGRHPVPARRAQRVRRRVQHVPAAAARRRPRRDRHLRAHPRSAANGQRYFADVDEDDAVRDGRDRRAGDAPVHAGLYLDITKPIG